MPEKLKQEFWIECEGVQDANANVTILEWYDSPFYI